jgi:hypothetical protein
MRYDTLTIGFDSVESNAAHYACVVLGSADDTVDLPSASGAQGIGFLQPKQNATSYTAADQCDVQILGVTPYNKPTGTTITRGDKLMIFNTSGELCTLAGSGIGVGIAMESLASADTRGSCLIIHTA